MSDSEHLSTSTSKPHLITYVGLFSGSYLTPFQSDVAAVVIIAANSCCRSLLSSLPPMGPPFWSRWQPEEREREREAKQRLKEPLKDKATQQWEMIWVGNYRI